MIRMKAMSLFSFRPRCAGVLKLFKATKMLEHVVDGNRCAPSAFLGFVDAYAARCVVLWAAAISAVNAAIRKSKIAQFVVGPDPVFMVEVSRVNAMNVQPCEKVGEIVFAVNADAQIPLPAAHSSGFAADPVLLRRVPMPRPNKDASLWIVVEHLADEFLRYTRFSHWRTSIAAVIRGLGVSALSSRILRLLRTGFNNIDLLLSRALSAAEAAQWVAEQNHKYRGV